MPEHLGAEVKRTFDLAAMRREAALSLTGEEWRELQALRERHAAIRRFETRTYELEYETRVEEEKRKLIDKAGSKSWDLRHVRFGSDTFSKSAVDRQARRNVRAAHRQDLARLDREEMDDLDALLRHSKHREAQRVKPLQDFARATDRRRGGDRRRIRPRER
ncbi:MAG: hypothetical protein ROR55_02910 [Devosia sp.]